MLRFGGMGLLVAAVAVAVPVAATASSHVSSPHAQPSAAAGLVYGGQTSQGWPVVIEMRRDRRQVVRAITALHLDCTGDEFSNIPDAWLRLPVNKRRRFSSSFGPDTDRNPDGTTADFSGSISGGFNRARTKVSGTWHFHITDYDTSGAVTGNCDSGPVRWSAKQ
jgi:hypothetical protein